MSSGLQAIDIGLAACLIDHSWRGLCVGFGGPRMLCGHFSRDSQARFIIASRLGPTFVDTATG
jgi:hypothetical protein